MSEGRCHSTMRHSWPKYTLIKVRYQINFHARTLLTGTTARCSSRHCRLCTIVFLPVNWYHVSPHKIVLKILWFYYKPNTETCNVLYANMAKFANCYHPAIRTSAVMRQRSHWQNEGTCTASRDLLTDAARQWVHWPWEPANSRRPARRTSGSCVRPVFKLQRSHTLFTPHNASIEACNGQFSWELWRHKLEINAPR